MENGRSRLPEKKVAEKLLALFQRLSLSNRGLDYTNSEVVIKARGSALVRITAERIITSVQALTDSVFVNPSTLGDSFISDDQLKKLMDATRGAANRLDHIGFCYLVPSQEEERRRIADSVKKTDWQLYEMESGDFAKWYFIGDTHTWQDPMIELLPALPNRDPDVAYWLPHIQVDIHTSFSAVEITGIIDTIFHEARRPILYSHPQSGVHCVRLWLGTVDGININLDLSTKVRNLQWVRAHMLHPVPA